MLLKLRVPHEIRAPESAPAAEWAATTRAELLVANGHIKRLSGGGPEHYRPYMLSTSLPLGGGVLPTLLPQLPLCQPVLDWNQPQSSPSLPGRAEEMGQEQTGPRWAALQVTTQNTDPEYSCKVKAQKVWQSPESLVLSGPG